MRLEGSAAPEVDRLYFGMLSNGLCVALRNQSPASEHENSVRMPEHDIHAVFRK